MVSDSKENIVSDNKETIFTGKVEWFDPRRGFGFISRDDGGKDVFVHYSDIKMEGFKVIMANDLVAFEEGNTFKNKLKAVNVKVVGKYK